MSIHVKPTDITPIVEAIKTLQEQHARDNEQTRELLKSVVEELQGIRAELQGIKRDELQEIKRGVGVL